MHKVCEHQVNLHLIGHVRPGAYEGKERTSRIIEK